MHRMKRQRVHGIDHIDALRRRLPMALERILARLGLVARIEPLDRDAAFDGRAGVPGVVGHAGDGAGHEFEGALAALPGGEGEGVGWGLGGLRGEGGEGGEVVDVEGAGGHGEDELGRGEGEGEGFGGEGDGGWDEGGGGGWVVDVQGRVPGGGD